LILRSSKGKKSPWALVFYNKSHQDPEAGEGVVRIEARAWSARHIRKLSGSESRKFSDVLFGGSFLEYFRWCFKKLGITENMITNPMQALNSAKITRARKTRILSLLEDAGKHGWQWVKDHRKGIYAGPIGSSGYQKFQGDIGFLRDLGISSPDADSNQYLGSMCLSVMDAARKHHQSRILLPDRMDELIHLCQEFVTLIDRIPGLNPDRCRK
jgi:hypothetical protein